MQKHLHLLGICGTFMGGLAIIARQLGYKVTGSDENVYPPMSDTLRAQGIEIQEGYCIPHLQPSPDAVIIGNVCSRGNLAVEYVLDEQIPYYSGPEWLFKEVLSKRHVLAVAGTHGKTTTSALLAWVLEYAGLKPGYLIGGVSNNFTLTAELGQAPYFVIEADEYDSAFFDKRPKFLHYHPSTLIITNIEFDHADIYENLTAIKKQFSYLLRNIPNKKIVLTNQEDKNSQDVLAKGIWSRHAYYTGSNSDWQYELMQADGSEFQLFFKDKQMGKVKWQLIGEHNIENALAVLAAANEIGITAEIAIAALNAFQGVKRRMEVVGQVNNITIYDDFAHHPTAIAKTLAALRAKIGNKPIVAVLQFGSNTMRSGKHGYADIAHALAEADRIVMLQPDDDSFNVKQLQLALAKPSAVYPNVAQIVTHLSTELQPDDSVLIMSNKGFGGLHQQLLSACRQ